MKPTDNNVVNCIVYPTLLPDSDISGVGVSTAFVGTAYLTLICCITKAVIDHKRVKFEESPLLDRWSLALSVVIVSMSDQQVITGISIAVAGLLQLRSGIQIYHWFAITNLAWFSTMTHLLTLTILRDEVRSIKPIRVLRIIGMGVLIVFLVNAFIPVAVTLTAMRPNIPVLCVYTWLNTDKERDLMWPYFIFITGTLVYAFCSRVALLSCNKSIFRLVFRVSPKNPLRWLEELLLKLENTKSSSLSGRIFRVACFRMLFASYAVLLTCYELYQSRLWEITWLALAIAWGTIKIYRLHFVIRIYNLRLQETQVMDELRGAQTNWGFGQVIAVGLTIVPLLQFFGSFFSPVTKPIERVARQHDRVLPEDRIMNFRESVRTLPLSRDALREQLLKSSWMRNMFWLCYSLSLVHLIDLLFCLPDGLYTGIFERGDETETPKDSIVWVLETYGLRWGLMGVLNFLLLWIPSLILLDSCVWRYARFSRLGRFVSRHKVLAGVLSIMFTTVLFLISITAWILFGSAGTGILWVLNYGGVRLF